MLLGTSLGATATGAWSACTGAAAAGAMKGPSMKAAGKTPMKTQSMKAAGSGSNDKKSQPSMKKAVGGLKN